MKNISDEKKKIRKTAKEVSKEYLENEIDRETFEYFMKMAMIQEIAMTLEAKLEKAEKRLENILFA